jgi:hypothetical protein
MFLQFKLLIVCALLICLRLGLGVMRGCEGMGARDMSLRW